ncbi:MAG: GDP-L-fucose synthase [Anaerolineae bacterium]
MGLPVSFWKENRFLVTGGAGFVGSFVTASLRARGAEHVFVPRSRDYDLRLPDAIVRLLDDSRPDVVIHLAAVVGGIGANRSRPAEFFYENLVMSTHLLHEAWRSGVKKFISIGTVCAYPKYTEIPFKESSLWDGYPEETNAPYGLAKKMLLVQGQAYREQYGFNAIYLLPTNLYGPGDNFHPQTSHVIPALIHKFSEAQEAGADQVVAWGSGTPTRDFLYVADAAEGILLATEHYNQPEPVNLGSGVEISIRELAQRIAGLIGYEGPIVWDTSQPDGQPRRLLDVSRALQEFGFRATTSLEEGLGHTIRWHRERKRESHDAG